LPNSSDKLKGTGDVEAIDAGRNRTAGAGSDGAQPAVKQGKTRIDAKCGKCGAPNRAFAAPGETRVEFKCKECGHKQKTL
jgi:hypothetical protein